MPQRAFPRIAIIGGGFTGAAIAYHLDRLLPGHARAAITIVEPRELIGAGLAYSTQDPEHRINVPASRMSLDLEEPGQFETWLEQTNALADDPSARLPDGRIFPRRAIFGRYVADALVPALSAGRITHRRAEAVRIDLIGERYLVSLGDHAALEADLIVIATTHPPPEAPQLFREAMAGDPRLITDATRPDALSGLEGHERVLIVGTGLTMADIVASLSARGHRGLITAFSRRGQLSAPHAPDASTPFGDFIARPDGNAIGLLKRIRATVREAQSRGIAWQAVFDTLRLQGRAIWRALPLAERRRLVRHLRAYWDARRFRIAPQAHAMIEKLRNAGQLQIHAGTAMAVKAQRDVIDVSLRLRHGSEVATIAADRIIIATGPAHAGILAGSPYLRSLAEQGLIRADAVGLGLDTDASGRAVGRNGRALSTLFVGGPLARGTFGELMGLPEVARYSVDVALEIAQWAVSRTERLRA